jgi:hypothetical protein
VVAAVRTNRRESKLAMVHKVSQLENSLEKVLFFRIIFNSLQNSVLCLKVGMCFQCSWGAVENGLGSDLLILSLMIALRALMKPRWLTISKCEMFGSSINMRRSGFQGQCMCEVLFD